MPLEGFTIILGRASGTVGKGEAGVDYLDSGRGTLLESADRLGVLCCRKPDVGLESGLVPVDYAVAIDVNL